MWPAQLGNQRPMCHFTQTAMHNTWWCWIRGDKSEPILLTFFWCLDTRSQKKYIIIYSNPWRSSAENWQEVWQKTINYYEFPEHENTLSESSKSPHFLLFTHEGDNFHLSSFSVGEQKILSICFNINSWKNFADWFKYYSYSIIVTILTKAIVKFGDQ